MGGGDCTIFRYSESKGADQLHGYCTADLLRPSFFYFLFYRFFSQQASVGGRNKNKIHSDHFPIELKSKETQNFILPIKMAISHQLLSLGVI